MLSHYKDSQDKNWDAIRQELANGKKTTHWLWFVFPQIAGVNPHPSPVSFKYELKSIKHAEDYLNDSTLRDRLHVAINLLMMHKHRDIEEILPYPDNLKVISSMTLFSQIDSDNEIYLSVLDAFNNGNPDQITLDIVNHEKKTLKRLEQRDNKSLSNKKIPEREVGIINKIFNFLFK